MSATCETRETRETRETAVTCVTRETHGRETLQRNPWPAAGDILQGLQNKLCGAPCSPCHPRFEPSVTGFAGFAHKGVQNSDWSVSGPRPVGWRAQ